MEHAPSAEPAQPDDRTGSDEARAATALVLPPRMLPANEAALAWIHHLRRGGSFPDRATLIRLLELLVVARAPSPPVAMATRADGGAAALPDVKLILLPSGKKFPHMLETGNGRLDDDEAIWTQCKTKMTHVHVKLVDSQGDSVRGADLEEGGLRLRLTLHKLHGDDDCEPLDDECNPRPSEGLLRGRASGVFEPVARLDGSWYEFRCQVMLLSSDIGGARMFVKVAPTDPQLALDTKLTVQSRSFLSRARMPDESYSYNRDERQTAKRQAAASQLLTMALTLVDTQELSPPASVNMDASEEAPNKRHCSPEPPGVSQTDTL